MPDKDMSAEDIQDILILDKPQDIRLIFNEKHNAILKMVMADELSISDISRMLNLNPGSVHYHLKELERHGLVKQVREEIKGGVIKKYYRSAARRILFDSPNLCRIDRDSVRGDLIDHLIYSLEYLGYHLPPENLDEARELLLRYDKRIKDILAELEITRPGYPDDELMLQGPYHLILSIKARDDPELCNIHSTFARLFFKRDKLIKGSKKY